MFKILDKKFAKHMRLQCTPFQNLLAGPDRWLLGSELAGWHRHHNFTKFSEHNQFLTKLFKDKPICYRGSEGLVYYWGFSYRSDEDAPNNCFIIYHDKRGLAVEVHQNFRKDQIEELIQLILEKLKETNLPN